MRLALKDFKLTYYEPPGVRDAMQVYACRMGWPPYDDRLAFFHGLLPDPVEATEMVRVSVNRDDENGDRRHVSISIGRSYHGTSSTRCPKSDECTMIIIALGSSRDKWTEDFSGRDPHVRHFYEDE